MISVIIPAHDEERVIGRCLSALLEGTVHDELEVIVVCNGCRDGTERVAAAVGPPVGVVSTPVTSKRGALNLGDGQACYFPRVYLDADVVLDSDVLRAIAGVLTSGAFMAVAPRVRMDLSRASWPVRAYYRIWTGLPYCQEGMIGAGVYALSEQGHARLGSFPDVVADDGYVRALFQAHERTVVGGAWVTVVAPATLGALLKIKTRSRLGQFELRQKFPDLVAQERKDYGGALRDLAGKPSAWPALFVYLGVVLLTRWRARRQLRHGWQDWARDGSSRGEGVT